MGIQEKIAQDRIAAMREKNGPVKSITQILGARFKNEEIALKAALSDEQALALVRKELKQAQDSLRDAETAGRGGDEYAAQIAYMEALVPPAMPPEEVARQVAEIAATLQNPNKGSLMQAVMPKLKGKAEGRDISAAVDAYLKK